jgi:hypothetical protein
MKKVKEYLVEYCKLCLGLEEAPRGLDHNTEFADFLSKTEPASVLIGYEDKTKSFVVGTEGGHMDAWILLAKPEGDIDNMDLGSSLQISICLTLEDLKELMAGQILDSIAANEPAVDSLEFQLMEVMKADLYSSPTFFSKIKSGEMSTVTSFEDEMTIQTMIKEQDKSKDAERFAGLLETITSYTDQNRELSSAQIDSSIKEVIECFKELIKPDKDSHKPYEKARLARLIEIYAERLFKEAHKENSQIDLFDYENCNMRLKLSMWKDILERYMVQSQEIASIHNFEVGSIFEGPYSDYMKKLSSASYLRGIYDELIRFCKYYNLKECDDKLIAFNQRRKDEKLSAKAERDTFFKEFTPYLMQIIEHVETQLMPRFSSNPKTILEEIKKWNNVMNFRKNTPEVKKIREDINSKLSQVVDQLNVSLKSTVSKIDEQHIFLERWVENTYSLELIKSLVNSILDSPNEENNKKLDETKSQYRTLLEKFCSKIEADKERMRTQDQRSYEESVGKRLDLSIEEDIYIFLVPSVKADDFSELLLKMKQYQLDDHFSPSFKNLSREILSMRESTNLLRQILQTFMFNIERIDETLFGLVKGDMSVTNLLKCLKKRQEGECLVFKDAIDAENFLLEVDFFN